MRHKTGHVWHLSIVPSARNVLSLQRADCRGRWLPPVMVFTGRSLFGVTVPWKSRGLTGMSRVLSVVSFVVIYHSGQCVYMWIPSTTIVRYSSSFVDVPGGFVPQRWQPSRGAGTDVLIAFAQHMRRCVCRHFSSCQILDRLPLPPFQSYNFTLTKHGRIFQTVRFLTWMIHFYIKKHACTP